ncbi:MAG: thioredoxin [Nocardioidaceae bacterium]
MATTTLGQDNFETTINENDIVLVDWWASWCGPCRMFAPIFERAAEDNPDIVFGKIDTEAERGLSAAAGITSIPTLMAFKDGSLVFAQPGALPAPALAELVQAVRDLDIEAARQAASDRESADQEAATS